MLQNGHRATVSLVPEPTKAARVQQEEDVELEVCSLVITPAPEITRGCSGRQCLCTTNTT